MKSGAQRDVAESVSSGRPEAPSYTKGPWRVSPNPWSIDGRTVTEVIGPFQRDIYFAVEDARLIAAAPESVDFARACLQVRGWFEGNLEGALEEIESRAKIFLAKATGNTP